MCRIVVRLLEHETLRARDLLGRLRAPSGKSASAAPMKIKAL